MKKYLSLGIAAALLAPALAMADTGPTVSWTNWNSNTGGTVTQNSNTITVTYTGNNLGVSHDASIYDVPGSFTSAEVSSTPGSNGTVIMSGGTGGTVNTFHFSAPVVNPYIAVFSVGQGSVPVAFNFDQNFTLLSQGSGHWGGGTLVASGNSLVGHEGNGVIKFTGTYTDITFTTPNYEYYYGATIGVASVAAVPEPGTYAMLLAGLGLVGAIARRRKQA